jgi:hypothetical protein
MVHGPSCREYQNLKQINKIDSFLYPYRKLVSSETRQLNLIFNKEKNFKIKFFKAFIDLSRINFKIQTKNLYINISMITTSM